MDLVLVTGQDMGQTGHTYSVCPCPSHLSLRTMSGNVPSRPRCPIQFDKRKVGAEDRATTEFRCGLFLGRDFTLTLGKAILVIGGRLPVDDLAGDDHGGGQSPETDSIVCT